MLAPPPWKGVVPALLVLLALSCVHATPSGDYDLFLFVQRWPGTEHILQGGVSAHIDDLGLRSWTVHGLWPNRADGSWPEYCEGPAYHGVDLGDMRAGLTRLWADYYGSDEAPDELWRHEWVKHGTCSSEHELLRTARDYFRVTLDHLRLQIDTQQQLELAGISPDLGQGVWTATLRDALKLDEGRPLLTCRDAVVNGTKVTLLDQVIYCLDKETLTVDPCPVAIERLYDTACGGVSQQRDHVVVVLPPVRGVRPADLAGSIQPLDTAVIWTSSLAVSLALLAGVLRAASLKPGDNADNASTIASSRWPQGYQPVWLDEPPSALRTVASGVNDSAGYGAAFTAT